MESKELSARGYGGELCWFTAPRTRNSAIRQNCGHYKNKRLSQNYQSQKLKGHSF